MVLAATSSRTDLPFDTSLTRVVREFSLCRLPGPSRGRRIAPADSRIQGLQISTRLVPKPQDRR